MISTSQIHRVVAVRQKKSLTKAAQSNNVTQSALTRSISTLEEHLGHKLFERLKHGMEPTEFCDSIAPRLKSILHTLDDIEHEARMYQQLRYGELNFAIGGSIAESLLKAILPTFTKQHPEIGVKVTSEGPKRDARRLLDRKVEFILAGAISYSEYPEFLVEHICRVPLAVFVRSGHNLSERRSISFGDLAPYKITAAQSVANLEDTHPIQRLLNIVHPHIVCREFSVLSQVAQHTDACIVAPSNQFTNECDAKVLTRLPLRSDELCIYLAMISLKDRSLTPPARALLDLCKTKFGNTGT